MKLTPELLSQQWDDIDYKQGGFLQINIMHPLEWHIGYQSISQRTLLLLCNADIEAIESSKSLIVSRRHRESDNRWLLTFELVNDDNKMFLQFYVAILLNIQVRHKMNMTL